MDGLNTTCLGIILCPAALLIGGVAFAALSPIARAVFAKIADGRYAGLSILVAGTLALAVACLVFYLMYAPAFPDYHQPFWRPSENDIVGTWTSADLPLYVVGPGTPTDQPAYSAQVWFPTDLPSNGVTTGAPPDLPPTDVATGTPAAPPSADAGTARDPLGTHSIEFRENGDFVMTGLPGIVLRQDENQFYSGQGTWSLKKDFQGTWFVTVTLSSQTPPYYSETQYRKVTPCPGKSIPCDGLEYSFLIWGRNPPYTLGLGQTELGTKYNFRRLADIQTQPK